MQHADEAPGVIEIGDHRALGDLEAHLCWIDTGAVEAFDDELEELCVAERLARDVDGDTAVGWNGDRSASECGEGRLHDPAVHQRHEAIALGGLHEFRWRYFMSGLVLQPDEDLHGRATAILAVGRDNGLVIQLEAIVLERALQALQPLNLAGVPGERLVACRINDDAAGTLFLRDITSRIRCGEQLLQSTAFAGDLHQADGDADVENLVLPDETVVADGATDVVRDLPRFLERTAHEQHAEFVATEASDRVAVTYSIAQDLGDLPQHAVTGEMAAGVVHDLEAVEIEITQDVLTIAAMPALDRFLEAPLELPPVDEARERIVRCLI